MKSTIFLGIFLIFAIPATAQIDPNWLDNVSGYEQPSWFNSQRVQIHSRLAAPYYNNPDHAVYSAWAGDVIDVVGATTFTRHVKTNDSPIHWQSAWGEWTTTADTRNIIQEALDEAHTNNKKMIGYYNHYTDGYLRDNYPQYKCKDINNNDIVRTGRGTMLCFNSPAVDSIQTRLIEFIQMGGDGIYFDEVHMPREGCWCTNCTTKYATLTGNAIPTLSDFNTNSQTYKDYQNFNNESVVEVFYNWRQAIEAENSEAVMVIGSNTFPKMINRHLTTDLMRVSHAHKTEWDIANRTLTAVPSGIKVPNPSVWRGISYRLSRDAGEGRPAHYWIPGMSFVPANNIKAATAGMISFGNIANIDMKENLSPDMDFVDAVTYGNTVSPAFEGTKPLRWLLVHYNEAALEQYAGTNSGTTANANTTANGWINFLSPFYGANYGAQQQRTPIGIITDSEIKQGLFEGAKVLFLPNTSYISTELQSKIDDFETSGGVVISQNPSWDWHNNGTDFNTANAAFKALLDGVSDRPFMRSSTGSSFFHANYFTKEDTNNTTYLASYSNNLEWITVGATAQTSGNTQPSPVSGIILTVNSDETPTMVRDVVTNTAVPYTISNGVLTLTVPTFQEAGLIEITYSKVTLNTSSFSESKLVLYPNPVTNQLNVKDLKEGSTFQVYDLLGKIVLTEKNKSSIDVSSISPGLYLLTILNGEKKRTLKFIKQ